MSDSSLKACITEDMKSAMRAGEKETLATIRLVLSAVKQQEVDSRETLDDAAIISILSKMVKQRRESITQFTDAGRDDLVAKEQAELVVIQTYLPEALSEAEIQQMIEAAVSESGAESMRDMGKVMGLLKAKLQGRADMSAVSALIKTRLS